MKKNKFLMKVAKFLLSVRVNLLILTTSLFYTALANAADVTDLGSVASTLTSNFNKVAKLITAGAYMAGIGFAMASMLKFKAHKDNPTQIPIGTPIALLFIGAALIFLPNIFGIAGHTIFGGTSGAGGVGGVTGLS